MGREVAQKDDQVMPWLPLTQPFLVECFFVNFFLCNTDFSASAKNDSSLVSQAQLPRGLLNSFYPSGSCSFSYQLSYWERGGGFFGQTYSRDHASASGITGVARFVLQGMGVHAQFVFAGKLSICGRACHMFWVRKSQPRSISKSSP